MGKVNEDIQGWILIHRRIENHWIWDESQYLKAWIKIILTVNCKDAKVLIQGDLIECKRGQSLLSLAGWVKMFGKKWTIQRVRTFFELLKDDKMITTKGLRKTTQLTVCNYDTYQKPQQATNRQLTTNKEGKELKERDLKKFDEKIVSTVIYDNLITNETR